ncbi:hypothetical protein I552_9428 [Mycobacterium xenopi 3993]|nr:hypothetical protein I552_9428 [Mycobacterium xenopi 3993]
MPNGSWCQTLALGQREFGRGSAHSSAAHALTVCATVGQAEPDRRFDACAILFPSKSLSSAISGSNDVRFTWAID